MNNELLPIGTVVLLNGGTKKVMICGYSSKSEEDGKTYDYNGCIFPEGFMENIFCLFNKNQIDEVCYKGYVDDDFDKYVRRMVSSDNTSLSHGLTNSQEDVKAAKRKSRARKSPTNPLSTSEMRAKYTVEKISGGQTEKFDFNKLK